MMLTALLLHVFAVLSSITCNEMKFDYHIREGKASFFETIETDLDRNTVRYYTPAHNDIYESHKFQDFKVGKQITCLPALRHCRLRDINRRINPDAGNVTESFVRSWNRGVNEITSKNSVVIRENYYIDQEITNTVSLGAGLTGFLKKFNFPLYGEKLVPDDAVIQKITQSKGLRKKRSFQQFNNDCNGQDAKMLFGMDSGTSCNYMKLCENVVRLNGELVFGDCDNIHITAPTLYRCIACPWVEDINNCGEDCKCFKLQYGN